MGGPSMLTLDRGLSRWAVRRCWLRIVAWADGRSVEWDCRNRGPVFPASCLCPSAIQMKPTKSQEKVFALSQEYCSHYKLSSLQKTIIRGSIPSKWYSGVFKKRKNEWIRILSPHCDTCMVTVWLIGLQVGRGVFVGALLPIFSFLPSFFSSKNHRITITYYLNWTDPTPLILILNLVFL